MSVPWLPVVLLRLLPSPVPTANAAGYPASLFCAQAFSVAASARRSTQESTERQSAHAFLMPCRPLRLCTLTRFGIRAALLALCARNGFCVRWGSRSFWLRTPSRFEIWEARSVPPPGLLRLERLFRSGNCPAFSKIRVANSVGAPLLLLCTRNRRFAPSESCPVLCTRNVFFVPWDSCPVLCIL